MKNDYPKTLFPIFLSIYFLLLTAWSWRKWPDLLVDFGRELYIPWQISTGKVLYNDIAHLSGPLSQNINGLLFFIFGPSLHALIWANLIVWGLIIILIYSIIRDASSDWTAFICSFLIMTIFPFSQYVVTGNYNFVAPYAHEMTHGVLFSLFMIRQMGSFIIRNKYLDLILAGFALGLISLTKIEIILSASMVALFYFYLIWIYNREIQRFTQLLGIFFLSSLTPAIVFWIYFSSFMPFTTALKAVAGSFANYSYLSEVAENQFYRYHMGLDNVSGNIRQMLFYAAGVLTVSAMMLFLSHCLQKYKNRIFHPILFSGILCIITLLSFFIDPYEIGRPLPVLMFISIIALCLEYRRLLKNDPKDATKHIPMLLLSVFAAGMLLKMILNSRLHHYGFCLALPSFMVMVYMLLVYLPGRLDRRYGGGKWYVIAIALVFCIVSFRFIHISHVIYKAKTFSIGVEKDTIITYAPEYDERAMIVMQAIEWIGRNVDENETIIVIPEGVMINYLTKRHNPTPYINFMPPEIIIFGEDNILLSFKKHSPDYIAVVHKNTDEYGFAYFGQNKRYGMKIMNWVNEFYLPVQLFGHEPLKDDRFGIKMMKRKSDKIGNG